jgi:DNA-binding MarR family transcriptional regulator
MATPQIREKHDGALTDHMDVRLWLRLLSCSTVIEKRLRRRFVDQFDSTLPRFDVLATLARYPEGVTLTELSRALLVSNGNVTALTRQLETQDLLTIRMAEDDRRSSIVAMTTKGRRHFEELAEAHRGWIEGMFAGMSQKQQKMLLDLLAHLKRSIAAAADVAD